jgi:hypothetical protein
MAAFLLAQQQSSLDFDICWVLLENLSTVGNVKRLIVNFVE